MIAHTVHTVHTVHTDCSIRSINHCGPSKGTNVCISWNFLTIVHVWVNYYHYVSTWMLVTAHSSCVCTPPVTTHPPSLVLGLLSYYSKTLRANYSVLHISIICWLLYYVYIPNETLHYFLLISWPVSLPVINKVKIKALLDWDRTKQYTIYIMTLWLYITSIMLIQYTTLYYIHYVCTIHYITVHTVQVNSLHVYFGSRCNIDNTIKYYTNIPVWQYIIYYTIQSLSQYNTRYNKIQHVIL